MGFGLACRRQVAGPFPIFRLFDHPRTNRIQHDVPAHFQKMTVFLDQDGLIPALEQVTGPSVPFIEQLGIDAIELPHTDGKIAVRGFDEKMIMVSHEAIRVTDPVITLNYVLDCV